MRLQGRASFTFALFSLGGLVCAQTPPTPQDPTEPLRRYPVSFLVTRAGTSDPVSLLRLDALHPKDDLQLKVDPNLARNWTFVSATVAAGQRIHVKSWNLWEKKWKKGPVEIGSVPSGDVVPLFFLVLNQHKENKVADAIHHALETSAGDLISQTASFQSIYQQQNRLLNFMSAYAALGPKQTPDIALMKCRIASIDADLGMPYDPNAPQTQPGDLQHGLDAGVGILNTLRKTPDQPAATAALAQQQLPAVVSDWIGLVGDLMHIFIRPPRQVKLTFIPAAAREADTSFAATQEDPADWMQLMTERVLDASEGALPTLVYRPDYVADQASRFPSLAFQETQIACAGPNVEIPLAAASKALYLHPWAWDWSISEDGKAFHHLSNAHLAPGRGLVFPINEAFWNGKTERDVFVRARVGFDSPPPVELKLAKAFPQKWSEEDPTTSNLAVGDRSATVRLARTGQTQSIFHFAAVSLVDSAGKSVMASQYSYDGGLNASFDLSSAAPGPATVHVDQEDSGSSDQPAAVFIEPRHPDVQIYCGRGDKELRVSGADAPWVKAIKVDSAFVNETDDSDPRNRRMALSAPLPDSVHAVTVTYREPGSSLEWTRTVPVSVGLPRPRIKANLMGSLAEQIGIGPAADPSSVLATLPPGWFATNQPVRIRLQALKPYAWTHDVTLELGLGSAGDVQSVATLQEGPAFSLDQDSQDAYATLTLDTVLPPTAKRNSGLVWFRLTRSDLSSPWTLATMAETPMRAIKMPSLTGVAEIPGGVRLTLENAEDVLSVRFAGKADAVLPQLVRSAPGNLVATIDAPAGVTEFDVEIRDASDGLMHVKLVKPVK